MHITVGAKDRFWTFVNQDGPIPNQSNPQYMGLGPCWIWMGARSKAGYGNFRICGKIERSHRVSAIMHELSLGVSDHVLHKCDNPACVNPDHLWIGNHQDNMADKKIKGRCPKLPDDHPFKTAIRYSGDDHYSRTNPELLARGERHGSKTKPEKWLKGVEHPMAKLSEEQVMEIRRSWALGDQTQKQIWTTHNISRTTFRRIINYKIWKHLT